MTAAARLLEGGYGVARPALFRLDPERAHELVLRVLQFASVAPATTVPMARRLLGVPEDPRLAVEAFGLKFSNPLGLAAGLDKNGVALWAWAALGFGHVEVGTVTPEAQPGNPRPRVFRLPADRALINAMGFPNDGAAPAATRLRRRGSLPIVLGGNVGKGFHTPLDRAAEDYRRAAAKLAPWVDYLTVNISSPNTAGLRTLQAPLQVAEVVRAVRSVSPRPVLVKLAPDLSPGQLAEIVAAARESGASGLIVGNTTTARDNLSQPTDATGGLSGPPLRERAQEACARVTALAGPDLPVIGVGGIASAADARARLNAGARLAQLYTALVYEGPTLPARILRGLLQAIAIR